MADFLTCLKWYNGKTLNKLFIVFEFIVEGDFFDKDNESVAVGSLTLSLAGIFSMKS